jgi:uncharacterized protein (DUF2345 family)
MMSKTINHERVSSTVTKKQVATPPPSLEADKKNENLASDAFLGKGIRYRETEKEITLTVDKTITIRCGKASITINQDGQIEIRGTDLVSRASGQNAIRGASISLN